MSVDSVLAPGVDLAVPGEDPVRRPGRSLWTRLRVTGLVVIGAQLIATLILSTFLFHRFHLIEDFGMFNQAWTLIGQGHLNPFNSIYGYPFYQSHFELIMWPLALIHLASAQPVSLLWIQDLTATGAGLVAFFWVLEHLETRNVRTAPAICIGCASLAAIFVNPLLWGTVTSDFHFESTAALFAVLAAREIYRERFRWAWVWVVLTLLCGDLPALYVVGIGISAVIAGRSTRRQGLYFIAAGGAWVVLIDAIGANLGSSLNAYAYLAGRATVRPLVAWRSSESGR